VAWLRRGSRAAGAVDPGLPSQESAVVDEGPTRLTQVVLARVVVLSAAVHRPARRQRPNEPDNTEEVEIAYSVSDKEQGVGPVQAWRAAGILATCLRHLYEGCDEAAKPSDIDQAVLVGVVVASTAAAEASRKHALKAC
jgi:hypothetical protein